MPAISFSTLKDKLLSGEKKQTIRPLRSDYWLKFKKGDPVYGYWKLRTKECEKLFESELSKDPVVVEGLEFNDELMIKDGFESFGDAYDRWFHKYEPGFLFKKFVVLRWE